VSPMSIRRFFSERGVRILASELVFVWIPAALVALTAHVLRRQSLSRTGSQRDPTDVRQPDGA